MSKPPPATDSGRLFPRLRIDRTPPKPEKRQIPWSFNSFKTCPSCLPAPGTAIKDDLAPSWLSPARGEWPVRQRFAAPLRCDRAPGSVRVATSAEVQPTVASFEPSYMTYPLPCDADGLIQFVAAEPILRRLIASADVVAVGPGVGQSADIRQLVHFLLSETDKPLVIDADGLNAIVDRIDLLSHVSRPVILTPHPGEFARLTQLTTAEVQADRAQRAAALASVAEGLVVVLERRRDGRHRWNSMLCQHDREPGDGNWGIGRCAHGCDCGAFGPENPGL